MFISQIKKNCMNFIRLDPGPVFRKSTPDPIFLCSGPDPFFLSSARDPQPCLTPVYQIRHPNLIKLQPELKVCNKLFKFDIISQNNQKIGIKSEVTV